MLPIIDIFGRQVGSYALLAFLGFIICGAVIYFACRPLEIDIADIAVIELTVAGGLLIGGHLLYGIVNLPQIINVMGRASETGFKATLAALAECFGGMVFYGGFLGGLCSLKIYMHYSKLPFKACLLDIYAFSIPQFHFFGRIGCFFAGCCYGIESGFGFVVNGNNLVPELNGVRRFPVSLAEALLNLMIFAIVLVLFKKGKFKGKLIYLYMVLYSSVRFGTEFLRGDAVRGIYFGISTSQWISIALFIVGFVAMARYNLKRVKN